MFIHWGLDAEAGGVWAGRAVPGLGEWLMHKERVPVAGYAALAGRFQPAGFDAEAWVRTAKEAGMRYIVITAKQHDGFAMFRSQASAFNMADATPRKLRSCPVESHAKVAKGAKSSQNRQRDRSFIVFLS